MPLPLISILIGAVVIGGGIALLSGSGERVLELTPNNMGAGTKPPLGILVYRNSGTGKMLREEYGKLSSHDAYDGITFTALSLTNLQAFAAQYVELPEIAAAFEQQGVAAVFAGLVSPGGPAEERMFAEGATVLELKDVIDLVARAYKQAPPGVAAATDTVVAPKDLLS